MGVFSTKTAESSERDDRHLFLLRMLLIAAGAAVIFFGIAYNIFYPEVYDPLKDRLLFSGGIYGTIFLFSYIAPNISKKYLTYITWIATYCAMGFIQWVVLRADNHYAWMLGWYLTYIACLALYESFWPSLVFTFYTIGIALWANTLVATNPLPQYFIVVLILSAFTLSTLILWMKLNLVAKIEKQKEQIEEQSKLLDEERAQHFNSSKLASLGEVAGGIAHEINNPLTILQGQIFLLKKQLRGERDEVIKGYVDKIESHASRIAKIVKGVRFFSRDGSQDPTEPDSFDSILQESMDFVNEKARNSQIDLVLAVDRASCPKMDVRRVEISQVIVNIVMNAIDHLREAPEGSEKWIKIYNKVDDGHSVLMIENSGEKISEEIVDKIFEPFFTTKAPNKGTGLGLSICKGIINSHGGDIYVDSGKMHTCFCIALPVAEEK